MPSSEVRLEHSNDGQSTLPTAPEGVANRPRERKRNRKCISCLRCHRLKVRCDRKSPCTRCTRSRRPIKCVYEDTSETASKETTRPKRSKVSNKHEQGALFQGSVDWNVSPGRIDEDLNLWDTELSGAEALSTGSSSQFPASSLDYSPYSEPLDDDILQYVGHNQTTSPEIRLLSEPTNDIFDLYWMNYLDAFEHTDQVLNVSPTESELVDFWTGSDYTEPSWLTHASMMPELGGRSYYPRTDPSTSTDCDNG